MQFNATNRSQCLAGECSCRLSHRWQACRHWRFGLPFAVHQLYLYKRRRKFEPNPSSTKCPNLSSFFSLNVPHFASPTVLSYRASGHGMWSSVMMFAAHSAVWFCRTARPRVVNFRPTCDRQLRSEFPAHVSSNGRRQCRSASRASNSPIWRSSSGKLPQLPQSLSHLNTNWN